MKYFQIKIVILLLIISDVSFSQTKKTGTPLIILETGNIKASSRRYIQYTETPDSLILFQSILNRQIKRINRAGKEQFLIIQSYHTNKTIDTDSSYCDLKTLLPTAYYSNVRSEGYQEKVIFTDKGIENTIITREDIKKFAKENKQLYNGVMSDDIIASLKLQAGAKFTFKALNPGMNHYEYTENVVVEGKEEIELPGVGSLLCWKVRTGMEGMTESNEWYTVKGHIQIKKRFKLSDGNVFYRILLVAPT